MKSLSLYVDKWFITVAVSLDGNVIPLSLPNGEDRIWLYFHEDTANSRIEYGKAFENGYRDKLPHYFGDIFNLVEDGDSFFTCYEGCPQEMREIFKVSGIFAHLRQLLEDESVETYIAFSADIPHVARLRFIEELEEANFKVRESVARISHLALEECRKRNVFLGSGSYLVLVATNDNFHFALYENTGSLFLRRNEGSLPGMGMDMRRRALVETVVENLNKNTKLLKDRGEVELECVRQDRYATEWLEKVAGSRPYMPVAFSGVAFAVAPNNPAVVSVLPGELEERTRGMVENLLRRIGDFVRDNGLRPYEIGGVVFIGRALTNNMFAEGIRNRFTIDGDKLVTYLEEELPKVVSVYSQIDCGQFTGETKKFEEDARTQEILNLQAREERELRRRAETEAQRQQERIDRDRRAERDYRNAVENIQRCESERNYKDMIDWAEVALNLRPADEFAKEKADLARRLIAEHSAILKQFSNIMQMARNAFDEERWSDAITHCEMALRLREDSTEAANLKAEARRRKDVNESVQKFLNSANIYYAQKLYAKAFEEIQKIKSLDPQNCEASEIERGIADEQARHRQAIGSLTSELHQAEAANDFAAALKVCDALIDRDAENIGNWIAAKERLRYRQKEIEVNRRKLAELMTDINRAHFDENWSRLQLLCEQYLALEDDATVAQYLDKASGRLAELKLAEDRERAIAAINDLILGGDLKEARRAVENFGRNYPSESVALKNLRKKLFDLEANFGSPQVASRRADDFFGQTSAAPAPKAPRSQQASKTQETDDFFKTAAPVPKVAPKDESDSFF